MNKGSYPISLEVSYTERSGNTQLTKNFPVGDLVIPAEIKLEALDDTSYLNDKQTEYIIGIAPVTVRFRGQNLFTDLGLNEDRVLRDMDDDGAHDLQDNATFEYPYSDSKLHTVSYQLPGMGKRAGTWFTFDLRVVESELARCEIDIQEVDALRRKYRFTPKFDELVNAQNYHYTIYDTINDEIVEKFKDSKETVSFSFEKGGVYEIQGSYFTPDGKKGSCSPEILDVGFNGNQVSFDLKWKQKESEPFDDAGAGTPVVVDTANELVSVSILPAILEFTVTDIAPDPTADLTVFYEGRQVFADREDVYEIRVATLGEKEFKFGLETKQGNESEQIFTIDVSRAPVRAMMKVEPESVGEDPFEVVLDASISPLYNEEDEIVYFSWDF